MHMQIITSPKVNINAKLPKPNNTAKQIIPINTDIIITLNKIIIHTPFIIGDVNYAYLAILI